MNRYFGHSRVHQLPLTLPAVLPTLVPLSWKFEVSWLTKCISGQAKIGYASVLKWPQKQSQTILVSKNFLGEHALRPPYFWMLMHAYIRILHTRNPPSKNPGYGPA